jgi:hypothetical protein
MEVILMDEKTTQYIEPAIIDYGSIADLTAGRSFRTSPDGHMPSGNVLIGATTGPCNPYVGTGNCTP